MDIVAEALFFFAINCFVPEAPAFQSVISLSSIADRPFRYGESYCFKFTSFAITVQQRFNYSSESAKVCAEVIKLFAGGL